MPIRRNCDPVYVQKIWDAIKHSKVADFQKIVKYLQNYGNCSPALAELYIKQAIKDKLIVPSRRSETSQTYKICQQELPELDGKDWYCFECHRAGDVTCCSNCFRVFHENCTSGARRKFESEKLTNNYPIPIPAGATSSKTPNAIETSENGEQVTIICDDSDDVIIETSNGNDGAGATTSADKNEKTSDRFVDKRYIPYDEKLCSVCNINRIDYSGGLDKAELNYMLKFVLHRIRAWLPNRITHTMSAEDRPEWLTDAEITWRANQLFFDQMDMSVIEVNLNTENYNSFSEFLADVYTIHHNVAIFHGAESQEYGAAEFVIRDATHDIAEMKTCVDCYIHSNEKSNQKWFCLPCRKPHQLVWAKQKGYPYWPAKVIRETETHCDVRFFGGKYERALLLKTFIKPIEYTMESLQIKNTAGLNKAVEELKYHQLILENPAELEKLIASSKPKKVLTKPRNSSMTSPGSSTPVKRAKTPSLSSLTSNLSKRPEWKKRGRAGRPKSNNTSLNSSTQIQNGKAKPKEKEKEKKTPSRSLPKRKSSSQIGSEKKKKATEEPTSEAVSGNVIDISDGEDEYLEYSFRENSSQESFSLDDAFEQVTSSTEHFGKQETRTEGGMLPLDQPYSDSVERMRRKLENISNRKEVIKCAMDCMQVEIDRIVNEHNEHLKRLFESHNQQISETKKKQWCYNCEQDAIYHCCWNTAYCSQTCQQQHWQAEHKKVCRRKRS